jgi:hypothetical protein
MPSYSDIRKSTVRGKYASGGRVADASGRPAKTVVNIVVPGGGMPQAAPAGPAPAPAISPSGGAPVPPQAAAMALGQMQGKPGMPGAFKRGGRVKCADGGAASGEGRLENARKQKRADKR